jgi:hypothetical protein
MYHTQTTMPVNWKTDMPIRVFVRDCHYSKQAKKFKGRVFNNKGQAWEQTTRTQNNSGRDLYNIEGALEVQRFLLLKLAEQDNRARELCQSNLTTVSPEDLKQFIVDTI